MKASITSSWLHDFIVIQPGEDNNLQNASWNVLSRHHNDVYIVQEVTVNNRY